MGVSKNNGTPKSSILIGFSIINHPFWGIPIFGNTHMFFVGASKTRLAPESKFYWGFSCQSDGSVRWLGDWWRSKASGLLDRIGWCHYTLEDFHGWNIQTTHFDKENDLNQTSMIMFQPLIFQGVLWSYLFFGKGIIDIWYLVFCGQYVCADMRVYIYI